MQSEQAPPRSLPMPLAGMCGALMGTADAVPGVSGGTIALVLGIYDRLLAALSAVLRPPWLWRRDEFVRALRFLVPLTLGLLAAYYAVTRLLVGPKEAPGLMLDAATAPYCYAFFFGLVLFGLWEPWRRIENRNAWTYVLCLVGAAIAFLFVGLPHNTRAPETWMLFHGGALAIAVMLLPGVSGSLLLVILGQYTTIVGAVHDREWVPLLVVAAGILAGLATFVPFLRMLLARTPHATLAVLTGMMAGSLRALWPWKTSYDVRTGQTENAAVGANVPLVLAFVVLGGLAIWLLTRLEHRLAGESRQ